ncbi:MAG: DUF4249 domain-containing protein [Bacteroidia bacterium]|nr:DUF4249 domain-containing protein [Bacteroidia bacterium]
MNLLFTHIKKFLYLSLGLLVFSACIDEIRLDIDADQAKISVDGFISDSLRVHSIGLSYSSVFGVGNDNIQAPISGASVGIRDGAGNFFAFEESSDEAGFYERLMAGEIGQSYQLEILLADGKEIRSKAITMPEKNELLGVHYEQIENSFVNPAGNVSTSLDLVVKIDSRLDIENRPFLRWRVGGQYEFREEYPMVINARWCYIPDNLDFNSIQTLDARNIEGPLLQKQTVIKTPLDHRFAWQYCFHIQQFNLSEEEYTYWTNIEEIINTGGSLFDPPPGTVKGNLFNPSDPSDQILGFFSVASVSYKRYFSNPDILNRYIDSKCSFSPFRPQFPECRDCRIIFGSTLEKPEYWIP